MHSYSIHCLFVPVAVKSIDHSNLHILFHISQNSLLLHRGRRFNCYHTRATPIHKILSHGRSDTPERHNHIRSLANPARTQSRMPPFPHHKDSQHTSFSSRSPTSVPQLRHSTGIKTSSTISSSVHCIP